MKDNNVAELLRLLAEDHLNDEDTTKALLLINECLCFATAYGIEAGLGYSYRANIFRRLKNFEAWIINVSSAETLGFKPVSGWEGCLTENSPFGRRDVFRLSYKTNPDVPFLVDHLELVKRNRRHLLTTSQPLRAGNVIAMVEGIMPLSEPLSRHFRCSWCLKAMLDLMPCNG